MRELDDRYKISEAIAKALEDPRDPARVIHEREALVKQRV